MNFVAHPMNFKMFVAPSADDLDPAERLTPSSSALFFFFLTLFSFIVGIAVSLTFNSSLGCQTRDR